MRNYSYFNKVLILAVVLDLKCWSFRHSVKHVAQTNSQRESYEILLKESLQRLILIFLGSFVSPFSCNTHYCHIPCIFFLHPYPFSDLIFIVRVIFLICNFQFSDQYIGLSLCQDISWTFIMPFKIN